MRRGKHPWRLSLSTCIFHPVSSKPFFFIGGPNLDLKVDPLFCLEQVVSHPRSRLRTGSGPLFAWPVRRLRR